MVVVYTGMYIYKAVADEIEIAPELFL